MWNDRFDKFKSAAIRQMQTELISAVSSPFAAIEMLCIFNHKILKITNSTYTYSFDWHLFKKKNTIVLLWFPWHAINSAGKIPTVKLKTKHTHSGFGNESWTNLRMLKFKFSQEMSMTAYTIHNFSIWLLFSFKLTEKIATTTRTTTTSTKQR